MENDNSVAETQTGAEESQVDGGVADNTQDSETETSRTIPYARFKEVIDQNNELKGRLEGVEGVVEQLRQTNTPKTEQVDEWTQKAQTAKSWGEFVGDIQTDTIRKMREDDSRASREAETLLNKELKGLYDLDLLKTKEDENKLIKFTLDKSKELGQALPLRIAYELYKVQNGSDSEERESVAKKIGSSKKSTGTDKDISNIRGKSLDEIIFEAKENAPKE